jgi:hypothetical protein
MEIEGSEVYFTREPSTGRLMKRKILWRFGNSSETFQPHRPWMDQRRDLAIPISEDDPRPVFETVRLPMVRRSNRGRGA